LGDGCENLYTVLEKSVGLLAFEKSLGLIVLEKSLGFDGESSLRDPPLPADIIFVNGRNFTYLQRIGEESLVNISI
jgi:hypothetical protein